MANQDAAFGLKPIGKIGQNRDAQGLSEYSIVANSATTIYFQDPVKAINSGTIDVAAAGDVLLGSLNGVFYTDPNTKNLLLQTIMSKLTLLISLLLYLTILTKGSKYNRTIVVHLHKQTYS
jgi:hypothetical protein